MTAVHRRALLAACALAAVVFGAMTALDGVLRDVVVLAVDATLVVGHLLVVRTVGPARWQRGVVLWAAQAGLTWLVAGDPSRASAVVFIGVGLVFALVADLVLELVRRHTERADGVGSTGTAPLPAVDDGSQADEIGFVQDRGGRAAPE